MKFLTWRFPSIAFLVSCLAAGSASAQTPLVLAHGLKSSAETWNEATNRLNSDVVAQVLRMDTSSLAPYEDQALQLHGTFGWIPTSGIAVGHSNGGLVAREWSRYHALEGIVSIGSPHRGAPLITNMVPVGQHVGRVIQAFWDIITEFEHCWGCSGGQWDYIYYQIYDAGYDLADLVWFTWYTFLNLFPNSGVLPQMVPGSAFQDYLNSPQNLGMEATRVGTRIGIVSSGNLHGGMLRAMFPDQGDVLAYIRDTVAYAYDFWQFYLLVNSDPSDVHASNLWYGFSEASSVLFNMDEEWCRNVSYQKYASLYYGWCVHNDLVVPQWSQEYPGASIMMYTGAFSGPAHTQEPRQAYPLLYQALTEFLNVPTSGGPPPPPPPPPGGGGMTANSAVRGCSGWYWWDPVFQPTAADCLAYCQQNGAQACEWHVGGGCYVEFGSGCHVEGGFSDWYAWVN